MFSGKILIHLQNAIDYYPISLYLKYKYGENMADFSEDTYLLAEIRRGNEEAFGYLFKSYFPRLRGYAVRFIDDEEIVRDIIQECFLKFWEKRELLSAVSVTSLLFAMVRNGCLNYLKHLSVVEKHRIEYLASIDGEERLYHADFAFDADNRLLYDELQEQIKIVIDRLPDRCREVFLLSRFRQLKNKEIADKLRISTTAVEKHISKALTHFAQHFKDKYPVDIYVMVLAWLIMNE